MGTKGERDRKVKSGRKRGRPSLGPRAMVKLYVRPDTAESLRELARVRALPANLIGQLALDAFFQSVAAGDGAAGPEGEAPPSPMRIRAHESARQEIERLSMGVPRS